MPLRIQRKRTKGWRMPDNTKYVGRGTKWGNPYKVVGDIIYEHAGDRRKILDPWIWKETCPSHEEAIRRCLQLYTEWLLPYKHGDDMDKFFLSQARLEEIRLELKGKNLSCFCKEGEKCHADILLELANN